MTVLTTRRWEARKLDVIFSFFFFYQKIEIPFTPISEIPDKQERFANKNHQTNGEVVGKPDWLIFFFNISFFSFFFFKENL